MRRFARLTLCATLLLTGCKVSSTTPPAAVAPGYANQTDQIIGQSLAALDAFVSQAQKDYLMLPAAQQTAEKGVLNNLIAAANAANRVYLAYHAGTQTEAQAQQALGVAQQAQASYTA